MSYSHSSSLIHQSIVGTKKKLQAVGKLQVNKLSRHGKENWEESCPSPWTKLEKRRTSTRNRLYQLSLVLAKAVKLFDLVYVYWCTGYKIKILWFDEESIKEQSENMNLIGQSEPNSTMVNTTLKGSAHVKPFEADPLGSKTEKGNNKAQIDTIMLALSHWISLLMYEWNTTSMSDKKLSMIDYTAIFDRANSLPRCISVDKFSYCYQSICLLLIVMRISLKMWTGVTYFDYFSGKTLGGCGILAFTLVWKPKVIIEICRLAWFLLLAKYGILSFMTAPPTVWLNHETAKNRNDVSWQICWKCNWIRIICCRIHVTRSLFDPYDQECKYRMRSKKRHGHAPCWACCLNAMKTNNGINKTGDIRVRGKPANDVDSEYSMKIIELLKCTSTNCTREARCGSNCVFFIFHTYFEGVCKNCWLACPMFKFKPNLMWGVECGVMDTPSCVTWWYGNFTTVCRNKSSVCIFQYSYYQFVYCIQFYLSTIDHERRYFLHRSLCPKLNNYSRSNRAILLQQVAAAAFGEVGSSGTREADSEYNKEKLLTCLRGTCTLYSLIKKKPGFYLSQLHSSAYEGFELLSYFRDDARKCVSLSNNLCKKSVCWLNLKLLCVLFLAIEMTYAVVVIMIRFYRITNLLGRHLMQIVRYGSTVERGERMLIMSPTAYQGLLIQRVSSCTQLQSTPDHIMFTANCSLMHISLGNNEHEFVTLVPHILLLSSDNTIIECTVKMHDTCDLNALLMPSRIKTLFSLPPNARNKQADCVKDRNLFGTPMIRKIFHYYKKLYAFSRLLYMLMVPAQMQVELMIPSWEGSQYAQLQKQAFRVRSPPYCCTGRPP